MVNISPESFYRGSVATSTEDISDRIGGAIEEGADFIDIGGMSTAPYLKSEVSQEIEMARVRTALRAVREMGDDSVSERISVDTLRASVARVALRGGASIINDVSGLKNDPEMATVIRDHGASLLAMAHHSGRRKISGTKPIVQVRHALEETLRIAAGAGIDDSRVVLDAGIGFFREAGAGKAYSPQALMPWFEWDCEVLSNLGELKSLRRPLCVGVSRKSFIGKILGLEGPDERLAGSLAATAIAVLNGSNLLRTHDVKETIQAVRVAEAILKKGRGRPTSPAS